VGKTINTFIQNISYMPWKCPVCGYENEDDALFCIKCGAQKPSQTVISPQQTQPAPAPQQSTLQAPTSSAPPQPTPQPTLPATQPTQPPSPQVPATPEPQPTPQAPSTSQPSLTQQATVAQAVVQQPVAVTAKYYILFIQTPYSGLINQKVPLNFDIFPSISIGRSPENIIIVPDPEVSRRHAVISLENGELYIEDLNSTNGTYIYDGKLFQPIKGKQKIDANSIIKLGNQTIIKVVKE
jgi:pSer/pThr/pTyr-binding forkhead associated (FHA) protein